VDRLGVGTGPKPVPWPELRCFRLAGSLLWEYNTDVETNRRRLWHATREYLTHWSIAGAILAVTGAAPEHWFAELMENAHLSIEDLPPWLKLVDYRLIAVIVGLSVIVGDYLWRHHKRAVPVPKEVTLPSPTSETPPVGVLGATPLLPDKPSIAVLAFDNLSGDPDQEYFSDGMTEEITTAIARLPWLFVMARNSSFTYKGKSVDVRQVARELGVRYVLEGSVRKAGNHVRITAQLIDTTTSAHIWADRFDSSLEDVFELQDQIASNVVGAIEPRLRQSEIERVSRNPPENLHAYDLYLRALAQSHRYTEEGFTETIALLERALAIDPSYAPAAALVGFCRVLQGVQGWGALSDTDISAAVRLARQTIEAERDDAEAVALAGYTLFYFAGETATAMAAQDRALMLNPNAATAWAMKGQIHALSNQSEQAIEACNRALRLSPLDPLGFINAVSFAGAYLLTGRFEQAIEWADRALHEQPRYNPGRRIKIAALVQVGRLDEVRAELGRMVAIEPRATIASFRANAARSAPEFKDVVVAGLRMAGLPED
jgi:TolB-like protein/Tfp pilus assembly protein PilF